MLPWRGYKIISLERNRYCIKVLYYILRCATYVGFSHKETILSNGRTASQPFSQNVRDRSGSHVSSFVKPRRACECSGNNIPGFFWESFSFRLIYSLLYICQTNGILCRFSVEVKRAMLLLTWSYQYSTRKIIVLEPSWLSALHSLPALICFTIFLIMSLKREVK